MIAHLSSRSLRDCRMYAMKTNIEVKLYTRKCKTIKEVE